MIITNHNKNSKLRTMATELTGDENSCQLSVNYTSEFGTIQTQESGLVFIRDAQYGKTCFFHVVQNTTNQQLLLLLDEVLNDGIDTPLDLVNHGIYKSIAICAIVRIPPLSSQDAIVATLYQVGNFKEGEV